MTNLVDYREHMGADPAAFYKTTLFRSDRLLLGLNCLEPGQRQSEHAHGAEDKLYLVLEGTAAFQLGTEMLQATAGCAVWAPAGLMHGVSNAGADRLVLMVGMAPAP